MNTLDNFWKPSTILLLVVSCKVCRYTKNCEDYRTHNGCFIYGENKKTERFLFTYKNARIHQDVETENWVKTEIELFGGPE